MAKASKYASYAVPITEDSKRMLSVLKKHTGAAYTFTVNAAIKEYYDRRVRKSE